MERCAEFVNAVSDYLFPKRFGSPAFVSCVRVQGNRQALPLCVMLLIQRVLGDSVVGYDPGANGIAYDHDAWLASKLPAAMEQDDSDGDDGAECFVSKLRFDTATNANDWTCDGDPPLTGELFCRQCLDHR